MNTPISQHILEVQNYIVYSEMGGFIDETDPWHSTLMLLEELKEKVLDEEEILDNTNKNWENTIMNYYIEAVCAGKPMGLPEYDEQAEQWSVYFEDALRYGSVHFNRGFFRP